jgi:tRNA nucleotidyltransferase (CCA-adding enzyme)
MHSDEALERLRAALPGNVREVCQALERAGHQAVTVGGAVRDAILGRTPGDWDVATSARPEDVIKLFKHTVPTGLKHGTVTIVTGRGEHTHVEVTTFRGEGAYTDARRPDHVIFGVPLVEDLARRDLRVNAMAYDPARDELIDPFGGQIDIRQQQLRAVGPTGNVYEDAVARFTEDGLRVMRAVRFAAQLEFALDAETERGIRPALLSLAKVSKERISDELRKILATRQPSRALRPAERTGILQLIAPELVEGFAAWDAWQTDGMPTVASRAELLDSWLFSIDVAPPRVRLGAMFAEIAPPSETRRLDRAVQKQAEAVLRRLKFSNDEIAVAAALVGSAGATAIGDWTEPQVRRLLADVSRPHAELAVQMWQVKNAPLLARTGDAVLESGEALNAAELAITGQDLITELKLAPGPILGRLLAGLLDRVLEDPSLNTRERLLELARAAART